MFKMAARCGCFLIRQHGRLKGKLLGKRKRIGRIDSGVVYEQALEICDGEDTLGSMDIQMMSRISAASQMKPAKLAGFFS